MFLKEQFIEASFRILFSIEKHLAHLLLWNDHNAKDDIILRIYLKVK